MHRESHPDPASLYLEPVVAPQLADYFAPNDRVYNAAKLLAKFNIAPSIGGWILYNDSKKQLHCYLLEDLKKLKNLANAYNQLAPIQCYSFITLTEKNQYTHQSLFHAFSTPASTTIGPYKLNLNAEIKDQKISLHYKIEHPNQQNPQTGILNSQTNWNIPIDNQRSLHIDFRKQQVAQAPALTELIQDARLITRPSAPPNIPDADATPLLHVFSKQSFLIHEIFQLSLPDQDDPFAEPDFSTLESLHNNYLLMSKMQLVTAPNIPEKSHEDDICIDVTQWLSMHGIDHKAGTWAVLNITQKNLITYNTPRQIDLIEQLLSPLCCGCSNPRNIAIQAYIVQLPAHSNPLTYQAIKNRSYQTLASFSNIGRSGEKSTTRLQESLDEDAPMSCEFEPVLCEDGYHVDLHLSLKCPALSHTSVVTLQDGTPLATLLKQDSHNATYLLLEASIKSQLHTH
ncbi:hypothetical protein ACFSW8_16790 [Rubritalea tangerina]|uniref:Uncharacterized protein n=2 Tax=Rubritalea tangerina TaxID=430798 RepID=A0ABW4ZEW0_9BACT